MAIRNHSLGYTGHSMELIRMKTKNRTHSLCTSGDQSQVETPSKAKKTSDSQQIEVSGDQDQVKPKAKKPLTALISTPNMRSQEMRRLVDKLKDSQPDSGIQSQIEQETGMGDILASSPLSLLKNHDGLPELSFPIQDMEDLAKLWRSSSIDQTTIPPEAVLAFAGDAADLLDRLGEGDAATSLRNTFSKLQSTASLQHIQKAYALLEVAELPAISTKEYHRLEQLTSGLQIDEMAMDGMLEALIDDKEFQTLSKDFHPGTKDRMLRALTNSDNYISLLPIIGLFFEAGKASQNTQTKRNLRQIAQLAETHNNTLVADIALTLAARHKTRSNQHKRAVGFGIAGTVAAPFLPGIAGTGSQLVGKGLTSLSQAGTGKIVKTVTNRIAKPKHQKGQPTYLDCRAVLAFALVHKGKAYTSHRSDTDPRRRLDDNTNKQAIQRALGMDLRVDYRKIQVDSFQEELSRAQESPPPNYMRLFLAAGEAEKISLS